MPAASTVPDGVSLPAMAQVGEALASHPRATLSVHDADGVVLFTTSSIDLSTHWAPHELRGRSLYELVHPDDVEAVRTAHLRSVEPPASESVGFRLRCRDGSYLHVHSRSWGTPGEDGHLRLLVCLTTPDD